MNLRRSILGWLWLSDLPAPPAPTHQCNSWPLFQL